MSVKYCSNCGQQVSDDVRFCPSCGTPLEAGPAPQNPGYGAAAPNQGQQPPLINPQAYPGNTGGTGPYQTGGPASYQQAPYQQPYPGPYQTNPSPQWPHYYDQPEVTLKDKYFLTKGRTNRKPYLLRGLILSFLDGILSAISNALGSSHSDSFMIIIFYLILLGLYLVTWYSSITIGIRRCHDRGNSGWWLLVPFYGIFIIFAKGNDGPNAYGPDPLQNGGQPV